MDAVMAFKCMTSMATESGSQVINLFLEVT